jgi:hypothetical protein
MEVILVSTKADDAKCSSATRAEDNTGGREKDPVPKGSYSYSGLGRGVCRPQKKWDLRCTHFTGGPS